MGIRSLLRGKVSGIFILLLLVSACGPPRDETLVDVVFHAEGLDRPPPTALVDSNDVGRSLKPTGNLYTVVFQGDYSEILRTAELNSRVKTGTPGGDDPDSSPVSCSSFVFRGRNGAPRVGRNFDNRDTDLVAVLCRPSGGYASIAFSPLRHLGFRPGDDLDEAPMGRRLSLFMLPFLTCEGINEKGVYAALNYVGGVGISRTPLKPARFVTHWVREVLDRAADLEEALAVATGFHVYDNGKNLLSHSLFLADAGGGSAVVEYRDGDWRVVRSSAPWQVLTNFRQSSLPAEKDRARICRRYRRAAGYLSGVNGPFGARDALELLYRISQHANGRATQWSWTVNPLERTILLRLRRDRGKLYRLRFPY